MKSKLFAAVAAVLMVGTGSVAEEESSGPTAFERFELWDMCRPVRLVVENLNDDAAEIGLTVERIETTVRSRLRAARIYDDDPIWTISWLYVRVGVVSSAFNVQLYLMKYVTDLASQESKTAITWHSGVLGTHGENASYILQSVSEFTDEFIDEYLRVNAEAC